MRISLVLCSLFLLPLPAFEQARQQQRLVVSPDGDIVPLGDHQSARRMIDEYIQRQQTAVDTVKCSMNGTFGYSPNTYPAVGGLLLGHKQVAAEWFEAPSNGTIDSIFWHIWTNELPVQLYNLPLKIRICKSNIYPGHGPGYGGLPPPKTCWGYYVNRSDLDQGITPYWDEATDTGWISTIADSTWDPLGDMLWGYSGYPMTIPISWRDTIIAVDLYRALGMAPEVSKGEPFFICIRNERAHMSELVARLGVSQVDVPNPSRVWKFYEHDDSLAGTCRGWTARSGFNLHIWYTMKLNYAQPTILPSTAWLVSGRAENEPIRLDLVKFCRPEYLDSADIAQAWVNYSLDNGGTWDSMQATSVGDTTLSATLPIHPSAGMPVSVRARIVDSFGGVLYQAPLDFRVVGLSQNGYRLDTNAVFGWIELDSVSGAAVPYDSFFLRTDAPGVVSAEDDGTADRSISGSPLTSSVARCATPGLALTAEWH